MARITTRRDRIPNVMEEEKSALGKLRHLAAPLAVAPPLLAIAQLAVAAALLATAPAAEAQPSGQWGCAHIGPGKVCQRPSDVEINDSRPVDFSKMYPMKQSQYGEGQPSVVIGMGLS